MQTDEDRLNQRAWVDQRLQRADRPWNKIHLDFHNTPFVGAVGAGFDPESFVNTLQQARVEAVVVFAKDMHGWFYYPAQRAGAVHPGLTRDLLGEQVAACRDAGIKVYAYYCVTWDNLLAEEHPDWLVVKRDRTTYLPKFDQTPGWTALCLRNPEFVELCLADSSDILTRYELDGIWYDMPFPINGECYCHLCLAALRTSGLDPFDIAIQLADKQQLWVSWQQRSADLAERLRPGCDVDQNNNTRLGLAERVEFMSNVDIEALPTGGWGYQYFPVDVRFARTFGVPVTGQTGRFTQAWADFGGLKTAGQLSTEMAQIVAQGAQICVGDQPPPSGRLDPAVYTTIGAAYSQIDRSRPYLQNAAPMVEAAIVAAGELLADPGRVASSAGSGDRPATWSRSVVGTADLLLRHRVQFDVVEPGADLGRYRLLVVPDQTDVDDDLARLLRDHLDAGGAVIAAGGALRSGDGDGWAPGVTAAGRAPFSTPFLLPDPAITDRIPDFPYALYGGSDQFDVADATILARLGNPMFERTAEHYTSHGYAPLGSASDFAVAWHRGHFGGLSFSVGTDYLSTGYWVYAEIFGLVLDAVLPTRLVRSTASDPLEISLTRQEDGDIRRTIVHLVPAFADRRWGSRLETYTSTTALADIDLQLTLDTPVTSARLVHGDTVLPVESDCNSIRLHLDRLTGPDLIVVE